MTLGRFRIFAGVAWRIWMVGAEWSSYLGAVTVRVGPLWLTVVP